MDIRARYVDLLKKSLLGDLFVDDVLRVLYLKECIAGVTRYDSQTFAKIRYYAGGDRLRNLEQCRQNGLPHDLDFDNLVAQHTMIGPVRLDHVERCFHSILADQVPGDFIECGIWRGGVVTFLRGLLEAYEVPDRIVWGADSFQGVPPPTSAVDVEAGIDLSNARCPMLAVSFEEVVRTIKSYGLLDDRVRFLQGWFRDTLPIAPVERLAMLRLDGDLFESTQDALLALYDRLSPGGYCIVDDYIAPGCRRSVDEFRAERGIKDPLETVDFAAVAWRKTA